MHIFYSPCFFGSTLNYFCVYTENTSPFTVRCSRLARSWPLPGRSRRVCRRRCGRWAAQSRAFRRGCRPGKGMDRTSIWSGVWRGRIRIGCLLFARRCGKGGVWSRWRRPPELTSGSCIRWVGSMILLLITISRCEWAGNKRGGLCPWKSGLETVAGITFSCSVF